MASERTRVSDVEIFEGALSYEPFKIAVGELWSPYATAEVEAGNLAALIDWGRENLGAGLAAFKHIGAYELAFKGCLAAGVLVKDPNWKSWPARKLELQKEHVALTGAESKARYFSGDLEYRRFIDEEQR